MVAIRSLFVFITLLALVASPALAGPPRPNGAAPVATAPVPTAPVPTAPASAAELPAAGTVTAAPPAVPKPGHVVIVADAEGLVAQVGGALHGLKKGANRFELPAGSHTVVVKTKKGATIGSYPVTIPPAGEATVKVATVGTVALNVADGGSLEVDGKKVKAKGPVAMTTVTAGSHSVVVKRSGYFGTKGTLEIAAGTKMTIDPAMEKFEAGDTTLAWVGILGGGALVLSAVVLDLFVDANAAGGDATRWALVGIGTAGFVGGTILMKDLIKKENNPPVHPGTIKAKLSVGGKVARFAFRF